MGKKYTKFVWPKYDARYRPGINDVLEEEELFPEEGFSEPEDEGESLYTAQEVWESRIIFRKRNDLIWSRRRIEPPEGEEFDPLEDWEFKAFLEEQLVGYDLVLSGELAAYEPIEEWEFEFVSEALLARPDHKGEGELPIDCSDDSDCPSGQVCVLSKSKEGTCFDIGSVFVVICGIQDEKTCEYCKSQIGQIRSLVSPNLPPFHEYCRCWSEYVYW